MSTKSLNLLESSNELFIWITAYFTFYFSDWIYNPKFLPGYIDYQAYPELIYYIGSYYNVALCVVVILNFPPISVEIKKDAKKAIRKRKYYKLWGEHYKKKIFHKVKET